MSLDSLSDCVFIDISQFLAFYYSCIGICEASATNFIYFY